MSTSGIDPIRGSHPRRRIAGVRSVWHPFEPGPADAVDKDAGAASRLAVMGGA